VEPASGLMDLRYYSSSS